MRNKRGQVALFVIIAIVIVGSLIALYAVRTAPTAEISVEENPRPFMERCVKEIIEENIEIMLHQGGYIDPENYHAYEGDKVAYLCYNEELHKTCVNQEPLFIDHLGNEIEDYSKGGVVGCFLLLEEEYRKRNYGVQGEDARFGVELTDNKVRVLMSKPLTVSKGEGVQSYEDFSFDIISNLYNLGRVAMDITKQESKSCEFNYVSYMALHPDIKITKHNIGSELSIYEIEDRDSGEKLNIGVRSCAYELPNFG